ncbi:hypothetical protein DPMN_019575 [Dreissena polymorpha]|uniref:Uncharacterized protein n=1 Tax=Dreissena polymorpha TaxID=45954 RepID=A0A9D4S8B6_DREPO|nr:hypothetical protein DPMN_019575 [Dreissena polymorpha]
MIAFLSAAGRLGLGDPVVVVAPFIEQVTSWWGVNSRHMACAMAFTSLVSSFLSKDRARFAHFSSPQVGQLVQGKSLV